MAAKSSVLIVTGFASVAAIAGIVSALRLPNPAANSSLSPERSPDISSPAASPIGPTPISEAPSPPPPIGSESPAPESPSATPEGSPTSVPIPTTASPSAASPNAASPNAASPNATSPFSLTPFIASKPEGTRSTPTASASPNPVSPGKPSPTATESPAPTGRTIEQCKIQMARVNEPNSALNVRTTPSTATQRNILGTLKHGTYVTVKEQTEDWFLIEAPLPGWIAKSRTENTCGLKTERVQFGQGQESVTITDRFIGSGSHRYRLNLAKGQHLTVTRNQGDLPIVVTPEGTRLSQPSDTQDTWTGELPTTGDYTLELTSSFKGYPYTFSVSVK